MQITDEKANCKFVAFCKDCISAALYWFERERVRERERERDSERAREREREKEENVYGKSLHVAVPLHRKAQVR
jgi:hypothetical protein